MNTNWELLLPLSKHLHGRVLDIGCGNGMVTKLFRHLPLVTEVVPADKARDPHQHGVLFSQVWNGHLPVQADIEDMSVFKDKEFDCTVAWQIVEHCREPWKAMAELARVTKDLIYVGLPMPGKGAWDDSTGPWPHLWAWNDDEWRYIATMMGFEFVQEKGRDWYPDEVGNHYWLMWAPGEITADPGLFMDWNKIDGRW